ncbi:MAG: addiction module protein [Candidatus Korobacteraceae bacterium]
MTEKVSDLLKQALALPPEARSALASSLLASLEDATVDEGAEMAWEQEIARRVDELRTGSVATIPWAEVRQRAIARINGWRS